MAVNFFVIAQARDSGDWYVDGPSELKDAIRDCVHKTEHSGDYWSRVYMCAGKKALIRPGASECRGFSSVAEQLPRKQQVPRSSRGSRAKKKNA